MPVRGVDGPEATPALKNCGGAGEAAASEERGTEAVGCRVAGVEGLAVGTEGFADAGGVGAGEAERLLRLGQR